jgi:hypothetical protein
MSFAFLFMFRIFFKILIFNVFNVLKINFYFSFSLFYIKLFLFHELNNKFIELFQVDSRYYFL